MMADALGYLRLRMKALGRTEWEDPDYKTIPSTRLQTAFHLEYRDPAVGTKISVDNQEIEFPVTVRVPYQPTGNPGRVANAALVFADSVVSDILKAQNRLTYDGVKNVRLDTLVIEPLADSNDNGVFIKIVFTVLVIISTR